jgi:hypothetical protein
VQEKSSFDYAVIRVVPRVDRGEFINAGLVVHCLTLDFLKARIHFDSALALAMCPELDIEQTERVLRTFPAICAGEPDSGPIALLPRRQRFHWLVNARSTVVQVSPVHCGVCDSPSRVFESLFQSLVQR